jgi:hypothetical protein
MQVQNRSRRKPQPWTHGPISASLLLLEIADLVLYTFLKQYQSGLADCLMALVSERASSLMHDRKDVQSFLLYWSKDARQLRESNPAKR